MLLVRTTSSHEVENKERDHGSDHEDAIKLATTRSERSPRRLAQASSYKQKGALKREL